MLDKKKALLLIGSPRKKNATSKALGSYLLKKLNDRGYVSEELHVLTALKKDEEELLNKVNSSDLIILSFPVYVDSLPAALIRALELIEGSRKGKRINKEQSLIAISNCGFPESFHNHTSIKICKSFADKCNFKWRGGLSIGGGEAMNGRPPEKLGGMTRNLVKALDITAESIANNKNISLEAINLLSKQTMPIWLYTFFGSHGWKTKAKKANIHKQLYVKPYTDKEHQNSK